MPRVNFLLRGCARGDFPVARMILAARCVYSGRLNSEMSQRQSAMIIRTNNSDRWARAQQFVPSVCLIQGSLAFKAFWVVVP